MGLTRCYKTTVFYIYLEVTSWFLGIGSKEEMQEEDTDLKNCLFMCSRLSWIECNCGRVSAKIYGMVGK